MPISKPRQLRLKASRRPWSRLLISILAPGTALELLPSRALSSARAARDRSGLFARCAIASGARVTESKLLTSLTPSDQIRTTQVRCPRIRGRARRRSGGKTRRRKKRNVRRRRARERGKRDLQLVRQWVAEVPYKPARSDRTYRLVIRRQKINESNQGEMLEKWRYRYVLSNLPKSYSSDKVTNLTYERCDQEKVIEQLQNGIAGMRMPTGSLLANDAFLRCARIAHNLKSWIAQLALPTESVRWQWKRFRRAFVNFGARVTLSGRRTIFRISDACRFASTIERALVRLQT